MSKYKNPNYQKDYYQKNKDKIDKYSKEWYNLNRDREIKKRTEYKKENPEWHRECSRRNMVKNYKNNPEYRKKVRLNAKEKAQKRRLLIITHYSNNTMQCNCCGDKHIEFLSIDHINGGGNKHRKELFGYTCSGDRFYSWLIRNNFPEGYQILCYNCNLSRGFYGYCPHQKEKDECIC